MTHEQLVFLEELMYTLTDVHSDKGESYEINTYDKNGSNKRLLSREEYLDHVISTTIDDLRVAFPNIEWIKRWENHSHLPYYLY